MKVAGLITEYNPFHLGHAHHIRESRRICGADYVVAVMSGDFVQRGAPALLNKHLRAEAALRCGADLVLELPAAYALSSAEGFAFGGVALLTALGAVTHLSFGSETGEIAPFLALARYLSDEPEDFRTALREELKQGKSFPAARSQALRRCLPPERFPYPDALFAKMSAAPNCILGIEYCKAAYRMRSPLHLSTVRRTGAGYHSASLTGFASASAIRAAFRQSDPDWKRLAPVLPSEMFDLLWREYGKHLPVFSDDYSLLLKYRLLSETAESLREFPALTPALARRIKKLESSFESFSQFAALLKTKELTHTAVCRALMQLVLNIRTVPPISYARVLGMRKDAAPLLSELKKKSTVPLLTKPANAKKLLTEDAFSGFSQDLFAANLYESVLSQKFSVPFVHECRRPFLIL